jgi:hypothetical protein
MHRFCPLFETIVKPLLGMIMDMSGGIVMRYPVALILLIVLANLAWANDQSEGDVVFSIGEVDQSSYEFSRGDFTNVRFVTIDADGEVDPKLMPIRMIHPDGFYSPDRRDAAQEVVIHFRLNRDAPRLVFRLARTGDSTTLVSIDSETTYRVTDMMLGSAEGGVFGSYDLDLGPILKGHHTLKLSIPDDGLGSNGSFRWDALVLIRE